MDPEASKRAKRSREQILVTVHTVEEEYMLLNSCCCCIPLRCGCYLIGIINLIGVIGGFIASGAFVWAGLKLVALETKDNQEAIALACYVIGITLLLVAFSMLPLLIPGLIFNIMLLVGLCRNKPLHLRGFVLYSTIFLFLWTLVALMGGITIIILFVVILQYYFTIVVRNQYMVMKGIRPGAGRSSRATSPTRPENEDDGVRPVKSAPVP